jgi:hypothetical protein
MGGGIFCDGGRKGQKSLQTVVYDSHRADAEASSGQPRREVLAQSHVAISTVAEVLQILRSTFGEQCPVTHFLTAFHCRRQQPAGVQTCAAGTSEAHSPARSNGTDISYAEGQVL